MLLIKKHPVSDIFSLLGFSFGLVDGVSWVEHTLWLQITLTITSSILTCLQLSIIQTWYKKLGSSWWRPRTLIIRWKLDLHSPHHHYIAKSIQSPPNHCIQVFQLLPWLQVYIIKHPRHEDCFKHSRKNGLLSGALWIPARYLCNNSSCEMSSPLNSLETKLQLALRR